MHQFFQLAFNAYERSDKEPQEAIVAIFLSFAYLEEFTNEIIFKENQSFDSIANSEIKQIQPSILVDLNLESLSMKDKLNKICLFLNKKKCPWDSEDFQSFDCLLKIRNALIHIKPIPQEISKVEYPRWLQYLVSKKLVIDPEGEPYYWVDLICDKKIASWSLKTVRQIIKYFANSTVENSICKNELEQEDRIISEYNIN